MNKSYIYIDGKAIVLDENSNHRVLEYQDNLDKILIQENIIETIKNKINELEVESKKKKHFIPTDLIAIILILLIVPPLFLFTLTGSNPYLFLINTPWGNINQVLLITGTISTVALPLGGLLSLINYFHWKKKINNQNIKKNNLLENLKEKLGIESKKLEELKNEKSKQRNQDTYFETKKVDDIAQLKELKEMLISQCNTQASLIQDGPKLTKKGLY